MRNFIERIATDGVLSPVLEKKGILGPTSGRRPGDVTIPIWIPGKALAIDVAVTSPFAASQVRLSSPCDHYAAAQKHKKYDASFEGQPYLFAAVVFETTGAINEEGAGVLKQLFRFAAKHLGVEFSSYCGRAWPRLLVISNARCLSPSSRASTVPQRWSRHSSSEMQALPMSFLSPSRRTEPHNLKP
jgi:hypothetical protein